MAGRGLMKRIIIVLAFILIITLTVLTATGCHKVDVLTSCDFSVDNIVEMRYSSSPLYESYRGNIYSINIETGEEEKFAAIANAWAQLKENKFYVGRNPINMFTMGGTRYYECIFKDGTSVKITRDKENNLYFNDGKISYRIKDEQTLVDFNVICKLIVSKDGRYLVGYIAPDDFGDNGESGEYVKVNRE